MRSISTAAALAVLFSSAALSVASTGTASATSAAVASVAAPGGIVADGAVKRVFVGDRSAGKIEATDYTGALVGSVSGISGVSDLALSDDGATLYAAAQGTHEIVALDAATLAVKARYPVATDVGPRYVAFTAGKLWFTYGDQWDSSLGSVDPTVDPRTGTAAVTLGLLPHTSNGVGINNPGLLDADPSSPGLLAIGETGLSSDSMGVIDVSSGTPQSTAWYFGDYSLNSGIWDIDLVPGTSQVLVNGTSRDAYAGGKFTAAGAYPSGQVADISTGGLVAQAYGGEVSVYRPDATQPIHSYATGATGVPDLTWAPDSSRVFALVSTADGYTVKVLTDPTLNVPTLTVNAPSTATRGKPLTVTGKLSVVAPLPKGVKLQVTRTDVLSPNGKALPAVTLKADGSYSFSDTPPAGGTVTYKAAYAGDATHTAAGASDKVAIPRAATTLTLGNNHKVYAYGKSVTFTAHLGPTYQNRTVAIWADPYGSSPDKLLKSGKVNASGNISVTIAMTRSTEVTAVFAGDARTAPRTLSSRAYATARISTAVSKYYRTGSIGSTSYYWFHKKTSPVITTTMTYYKGRSERFDLQVYSGGTWYADDSEYFALGGNGKVAVRLGAAGQSGIKVRVRAVYVSGSSGDNVNATTYSPWKYLYFTS
jgi:hypothetical protein